MAKANKCDRCGKFYQNHTKSTGGKFIDASFVKGIKIMTNFAFNDYDLCDECIDKLYKFMNLNDNGTVKED